MHRDATARRILGACALLLSVSSRTARAQSSYYNLDAGRPARVEDAEPTARYALAIDVLPFQFEHLLAGTNRYRAEPRLSYGILPFTDIEVRLPLIRIAPPGGAPPATGIAGLVLGASHEMHLETGGLPAFALAGEVSLPAGSPLAPPAASYFIKGLMTKTTSMGRLHLNAGIGSYSVNVGAASDSSCNAFSAFQIARPGSSCANGPPIIVDTPCDLIPSASLTPNGPAVKCMGGAALAAAAASVSVPRSQGARWFTGAAFDHAWPLVSTDVIADVFAERFVGLYPSTDWTGELGLRHQLTPTLMVDAGAGWHFAGVVRSTTLTLGATYELATPALFGR